MAINIAADPIVTIPVTLVGVEYEVTPPKWALSMKMAVQARTTAKDDPTVMIDTLYVWIDKAFGPANAKKVKARLDDPKDALDLPHIMKLMEAVVEEQGDGDPTS